MGSITEIAGSFIELFTGLVNTGSSVIDLGAALGSTVGDTIIGTGSDAADTVWGTISGSIA